MDPVTRYLARQGIKTTDDYFKGSALHWGQRWEHPMWSLVYRVEKDVLIFCEFKSKGDPVGISSAVSQFINKIRVLRRDIKEIKEIRGLILEDGGLPEERLTRQTFRKQFILQGGKERVIDGDNWLVY
ncbi:secretion protein [uncultured Shewanella sp.]|uniref:secretion protein n=1 Tax=uncultured Shewanella sp. TaxID=173975 RepID=UPI00261F845C|nr:secretion protein [uncultured Shewanella sp.]